MQRIGIIGGGPSGLLTGYFLQKLSSEPISMTLYEANSRVGGKVLTKKFDHHGMIYEAGAAEIYDYSPVGEDPLRELIVEEFGLPIRMMSGSAVIMNHHLIENLDDVNEILGPKTYQSLSEFHRKARDWISPLEFYNSDELYSMTNIETAELRFDSILNQVLDQQSRQYIENLIHSDLATEPKLTTINYGLQNYLMNDPAYMRLYSIEGGNERFIEEIVNRINANILINHNVKVIVKHSRDVYKVVAMTPAGFREDYFDYVVIALPINYLNTISFEGSGLENIIQDHYSTYNYPAHYLRFTILFKKPYWRSKMTESWCMLDQFGGCCLYDESSRIPDSEYGVLGWLLSGENAEKMSHYSDEELIEKALESLPKFMSEGREYFIEGHVHRWTNAVNAIPGGIFPKNLDKRHQPDSTKHPNLFFVGDYLFDSTLNGALDSANYVAHWIANLLIERKGEK